MQKACNSNYYVLQCDIKGYYPNMKHEVAMDVFRKMIGSDEVYDMAARVLREQYAGDTGYNPGSQMIQIVGIAALDYVDRYITEELGVSHYVRYMDDFILMHEDRSYLIECRNRIAGKLAEREFRLNDRKTRIFPAKEGITFLGFIFKPRPTGKIMVIVRPEKVKAEKRKLSKLVRKAAKGEISTGKVYEHYQIWRSTVVWDGSRKSRKKNVRKHGFRSDNHRMAMRMDAYFKKLCTEVLNNDNRRDQEAEKADPKEKQC